jgi:hypothetical protein
MGGGEDPVTPGTGGLLEASPAGALLGKRAVFYCQNFNT